MKAKVNLNSGESTPIAVKADPELLEMIDDLRRKQTGDIPSRTQLIIRAIKWYYDHLIVKDQKIA